MNTLVETPRKVNQTALEYKVISMYREVALHPEIEYHFEMGRSLAQRLGYSSEMLDTIPKEAIDSFAGVGYYFDLADLKNGEVVLDLGSGSGTDVFLAAQKVGLAGEVIGIDMTTEQLSKSIKLQNDYAIDGVVFQKGHIESLPIVNESIDVVISNGVINLSSNKQEVFNQAYRVLAPGGRLAISDIVSSIDLPVNITGNADLWAACIGGAMEVYNYLELIEKAGFKIITAKGNPYSFISNSAKGATNDYGIKSISVLAVKE
jgi:arsenite methyltransferase